MSADQGSRESQQGIAKQKITQFSSRRREDFMREVKASGLEQRVRYLSHGETYQFDVSPSHWQ